MQIGLAWSLDVHLVARLHALLQWLHVAVHLCVVHEADIKVELLKVLGGHLRQLRHAWRRPAQHHPLGVVDALLKVHGLGVELANKFHLFRRNAAHLADIRSAANTHVALHVLHTLQVAFAPDPQAFLTALFVERAHHPIGSKRHVRMTARRARRFHHGHGHRFRRVKQLEQQVLAWLDLATVANQQFSEFLEASVHGKHMVRAVLQPTTPA